MSRRIATSPTSTAKARHTLAALLAIVPMATVRMVVAEIAGGADVLEAAVVADVAAAGVEDAMAEAVVVAVTGAAGAQAADGTNRGRFF
jgi:hypothetical protein